MESRDREDTGLSARLHSGRNRRIYNKLLNYQGKLNKEYTGKPIRWRTVLVKLVLGAEKRVDVAVPAWVVGTIGKQINMNKDKTVSKYYVVSVAAPNNWAKGLNRGTVAYITATVKNSM